MGRSNNRIPRNRIPRNRLPRHRLPRQKEAEIEPVKAGLVHRLLSSLLPSRCIVCQRTVLQAAVHPAVEICEACFLAMPHNITRCMRCALPLPDDMAGNDDGGVDGESDVMCGRCIRHAPAYDYAYSLFRYEDTIIRLIHQLKFSGKISYARSIGELLLASINERLLPQQGRPDCIIPVPLHHRRLRKRGYNQSAEIARVLVNRTGIAMLQDVVTRQRYTTAQTGLKAKQRQQNIRGAFRVIAGSGLRHALIIDDVVTTGSTVNELATALKQQGVARVGVLSIARAPMKT